MLRFIVSTCREHKVGLICALIILVGVMVSHCERRVIEIMISTNSDILKYNGTTSCPYFTNNSTPSTKEEQSVFYFDYEDKKFIDNARQYAHIFSFLINGVLSDKYGGHRILFLGLVFSGIVMGTLYLSAWDDYGTFLAMYAIRGFSAEGTIWPAVFSIFGKLAKYNQRSTFCAYVFAASAMSHYLAVTLCSLLVNWKSICYTCCAILIIMAISWIILWHTPLLPPVPRAGRTPWLRVFGSLFIVNIYLIQCTTVVFWINQKTIENKYFKDILHVSYTENDEYILLMSTLCLVLGIVSGIITDYYITTSLMSTLIIRKIIIGLSFIIYFIALIIMYLSGCDVSLGFLFWLTHSIAYSTYVIVSMPLILDISHTFSGTSFGLALFFAVIIVNIFTNRVFEIVVTDYGNIRRWHEHFILMFMLAIVSILPFMFCNPLSRLIRMHGVSLVQMPSVSTVENTTFNQEDEGENHPTERDRISLKAFNIFK